MAINNGAEAIMISHNTVTALDDKNPASISINNHNKSISNKVLVQVLG